MANLGSPCPTTCWKGDPENTMAAQAKCKKPAGHGGFHQDKNGNHFDDNGDVVTLRSKR